MKKKILSQLYNDAVLNDRNYKELIDDDVYDELRAEYQRLYDKLLAELNEDQKILMDSIYEAHLAMTQHEEEAVFKYGVSLGIRMTSEAFVITEKTIEEE